MMASLVSSRYNFLGRSSYQRRFFSIKKTVKDVLSSSPKIKLNKRELDSYENSPPQHFKDRLSLTKHGAKLRSRKPRPRSSRHADKSSRSRPFTEPAEPTPPAVTYIKKLNRVGFVADGKFVQAQKPRNEDVPKLAHKLDRVLFSPGVHFLQDPRTRIFNFPPNLKNIVPYNNFNFDKVQAFVSASKDKTLLQAAIQNGRIFYSSTSSMTSTLHQFYLLLNNYTSNESSQDRFDFPSFTRNATEMPSSVIVEPKGINESTKETIYSVTSDKSTDVEILLSAMGHCLETLLTTEEQEFKKYLLDVNNVEESAASETESANIYNYSAYGDFLMRSQLDCYDPRLPGNGTFDLKTRAVCAIRYDKASEVNPTSYQIWKLNGKIESFEREFQDLIRTGGLLKYAFQARIGQMDGIFVAYHNISSFFGFQYLPLSELDKVFYSHASIDDLKDRSVDADVIEGYDTHATAVAESQFKVSLSIWQDIMKTAIEDLAKTRFKDMPFRLVMKRATKPVVLPGENKTARQRREGPHDSFLRVYVLPLNRESVDELQGFSTKLKTSFRDEISLEDKIQNLETTQANLNSYNEKLLKESTLLSYNVWVQLCHDGKRLTGHGKHSYPLSSAQVSEWTYRIDQIVEPKDSSVTKSEQMYLRLLEKASSLLTMSFKKERASESHRPSRIDNLRIYSEIGKKRLERWKNDENPPKVL